MAPAAALALFLRALVPLLSEPLAGALKEHFADVLRVGLPSAVGTLATNLTIVLTTAFVGHFGTAAIAGYGLASRQGF